MSFCEVTLWTSLALVAYSYLIYPLVLAVLVRFVRDPRVDTAVQEIPTNEWPAVSLVIAAYREEAVILDRLKNAVLLDYPADRFEIIIGCDGAEDLTGELVEAFSDSRVRLLQYPERRGKASVLNDSIPAARGEIIVLSDANTMMDQDAIKKLVRHFRNPEVGGVVGRLVLSDLAGGENVDGVYWRYENYLKKCEGRIGALLGANGAIYAIRKELYQPIPANTIVDDFLIGMRVHLSGRRLLYDERARAREETAPSIQGEFHRRARIGAGGFQSLVWLSRLLNPWRGRIALTFWSHKVLRWVTPLLLIAAWCSNLALAGDLFYRRLLLLQSLFYLAAVVGLWFLPGGRVLRALKVPAMFVSMNAALLVGLWRWLSGRQGGIWKRTERVPEKSVFNESGSMDEKAVLP